MRARTSAVRAGERRHDLLAMTRTIFHQGPAEIAPGEAPRLTEIDHAVMNVDFGFCQFCRASREAEHGRRSRPHLHQTDLADAADRRGIIAAFDEYHRLCNIRR